MNFLSPRPQARLLPKKRSIFSGLRKACAADAKCGDFLDFSRPHELASNM
jgi:hypothetical protein